MERNVYYYEFEEQYQKFKDFYDKYCNKYDKETMDIKVCCDIVGKKSIKGVMISYGFANYSCSEKSCVRTIYWRG